MKSGGKEQRVSKRVFNLPDKFFLIGFMGSGKSHWGKIWSAKTKLPFYDLDHRIEKAFKITIAEIFEIKGEEKFRELERYHLRKFSRKKRYLLACGGGTPCFSDNLQWMKSEGTVIYLKASPELIVQRLTHETAHRPVIKNVKPSELLSFIKNKLTEREPFYLQADHVLNVEEFDEHTLSVFLIATSDDAKK
ncbi:MAG: shikimate kinase [Ginsengibacter sp.]